MKSSAAELNLSIFRFIVYLISVLILIPVAKDNNSAIFVSMFIYSFGKLLDYIEKLISEVTTHFFVFRVIAMVLLIIVVILGLCQNFGIIEKNETLSWIALGILLVTCIEDGIEMAYWIVTLFKEKKKVTKTRKQTKGQVTKVGAKGPKGAKE